MSKKLTLIIEDTETLETKVYLGMVSHPQIILGKDTEFESFIDTHKDILKRELGNMVDYGGMAHFAAKKREGN